MTRKGIFSIETEKGLGIIHGWEAIGRYIGRSGRTARRWYDNKCLPVRRACTGRPFALKHELDMCMIKFDEFLRKDPYNESKQIQKHAAYMRSCKKRK